MLWRSRIGLEPSSLFDAWGGHKVWALPHSQFDRPVAFPDDGIGGQGKAVGTTPPTALLFWCGFCLKPNAWPPPWSVEVTPNCFIVRDHDGQALAYIYYEDEPGRRSAAKLLSKNEVRRIAANIAKLPR
jgi:hypothetical protein